MVGSVVKDGKPLKVAKVVYRDGDHNLEVSFDPTQTQPTVSATVGGEEGEPVAAVTGGGQESEAATVATRGQEENQPPAEVKGQKKSQLPVRYRSKRTCKRGRVEDQEQDDNFMEPACQVKSKVKRKVAQTRKMEAMQGPKKKDATKQKLTKKGQAVRKREHFSVNTRCQPNAILEMGTHLMDCLDPDSMCLDLGGHGKLPVTAYAVHCVLGLQNGYLDPPVASNTTPLGPIREELGLGRKDKITSLSILDKIKEGGLMTSQCSLLAPDSSTDITGNVVNMVSKDLEQYKGMALCKFVVDHLRWSAKRWKSGKRSTVYGCTAFLVVYYLDNLLCNSMITNIDTPRSQFFNSDLIDKIENLMKSTKKDGSISFGKLNMRCRESTCYFVSKGKGKVAAASENTRKRKHMDEEVAKEATIQGYKEAPSFGGDFPSLRSKLGPLIELSYTRLKTTYDPKIAYTRKTKKRRDGLPPCDSQAVTDEISGSGNDSTTQASIDTLPTQANDDLGKEQNKGGVESSTPIHVEDPTHAAAGQPCLAATYAHNDNDVELSNLVDKICTNVEGTHKPAIAPSHVADPSPVIIPIEMEKRRPLANPKYTSPFKCASIEPLWDDNGDNAKEVYKIYLIDQLDGVIVWKGEELKKCLSEGGKLTHDIMLFW
uniref:Uncharacterized protein n=1 Tax=Oryza punctata TaxID=4537 RepID=A0A0E0MKH3_ORYPU